MTNVNIGTLRTRLRTIESDFNTTRRLMAKLLLNKKYFSLRTVTETGNKLSYAVSYLIDALDYCESNDTDTKEVDRDTSHFFKEVASLYQRLIDDLNVASSTFADGGNYTMSELCSSFASRVRCDFAEIILEGK